MSASSIRSLFAEADCRLRAASPGEETLIIGVEYFETIGNHLASTVYLKTTSEGWENWQINSLILSTYLDLMNMVSDVFAKSGIDDEAYVQRCLSAAERGFLDRGDDLFSQALKEAGHEHPSRTLHRRS